MERVLEVQGLEEVSGRWRAIRVLAQVGLILGLGGCASTYPTVEVEEEVVPLQAAQVDLPEQELLDVRIAVLDPGELPRSEEQARGLSDDIREAESRYMAVELRNAMEQSGYWGAVRVVPDASPGDEVLITGEIIESNGEELTLQISATDATGEKWFTDKFEGAVSIDMYDEARAEQRPVFGNVYNDIANRITQHRNKLTPEEIARIRATAELRFAEDIAPDTFSGYVINNPKKGTYQLDRLPAKDDEMLMRAQRIRGRDAMLVDRLDAHYTGLYREMKDDEYFSWRKSRLQEINMIREVDKEKNEQMAQGVALILAGAAMAAVGGNTSDDALSSAMGTMAVSTAAIGVVGVVNAQQISKQADINKAALEELGESFSGDAAAMVMEVEGETVELTGSAEEQYAQWREVLKDLHRVKTTGENGDPAP
jgi:hypothetical protein